MRFNLVCLPGLLLLVVLLQLFLAESEGGTFYVIITRKGDCTYHGYKPGGGIPNIKPIPSPVAKGFKNSLSFLAGVGAGTTSATAKALEAVATLIKSAAKVAKTLSAGFGVLAAAFSFVSKSSKPSANDILERVNDAFKEITDDMNDRLEKLQGYTDARVITLEHGLVKNEFYTLQRYFSNCIKETSEESVRRCQRNANRKMNAALPKFQRLKSQFQARETQISLYDIKRLEAALISFRDFASLHLLSLQLLVNAYKEDPDSNEKTSRLKLYLNDIKVLGNEYYNYAQWGYKQIYDNQIGKHLTGSNDMTAKEEYIHDDIHRLFEGAFWLNKGANTANYQNFKPNCLAGDEHADINKCELMYAMRVDGKSKDRYPARYWSGSSKDAALTGMGRQDSKEVCRKYLLPLKNDLVTYWKKELLDVVEIWKQVADKAAEEVAKLNEGR